MEDEAAPALQELFESEFIRKAPDLRDIWLASIGHWQCKQYVEAVNALASPHILHEAAPQDPEEELDEFNLMTRDIEKSSELWDYGFPLLSLPKPTLTTVVSKLRGHYLVVNELEGQSASGPASIFASFHEESKREETKQTQKRLVIKMEEFDELNAKDFLNRGLPYFALGGTGTFAARALIQTLARDVYDKFGAQSL